MVDARSGGCTLPFLVFDQSSLDDIELMVVSAAMGLAASVEAVMASAVSASGGGRLRVIPVETVSANRRIFAGREAIGNGDLATALTIATGVAFSSSDIIFAVDARELSTSGSDEMTVTAVHHIACLIAVTAPLKSRDSLYLSVASALLLSLDIGRDTHCRLSNHFLSGWVRDKLRDDGGWNEAAMNRVRAQSLWDGEFMAGLGAAIRRFAPLPLPQPLVVVATAARDLQGAATLAHIAPVGLA